MRWKTASARPMMSRAIREFRNLHHMNQGWRPPLPPRPAAVATSRVARRTGPRWRWIRFGPRASAPVTALLAQWRRESWPLRAVALSERTRRWRGFPNGLGRSQQLNAGRRPTAGAGRNWPSGPQAAGRSKLPLAWSGTVTGDYAQATAGVTVQCGGASHLAATAPRPAQYTARRTMSGQWPRDRPRCELGGSPPGRHWSAYPMGECRL